MQWQRKLRKVFLVPLIGSVFLYHLFLVPGVWAAEAEETESTKEAESTEKAKTDISEKTLTVPIHDAVPDKLTVLNPEEDAVYIFQSANKKIASVGKKTGVVTGKKQGTAKISLYKKGKKKNKLIAVCTVAVKQAAVVKKHQSMTAALNGTITPVISWKNSEAEYTYVSANKKIVKVGEKIDDTGATAMVITALKEGKTTLTVKEIYKKKKTVVGKITVMVKKPVLSTQSISMVKGQVLKISSVVKISHEDTSGTVAYAYESADDEILSVDGNKMTAKKVTASINLDVYRIVDGESSKFGTVAVTIAEATDRTPEAAGDSDYVDLSDYNNDYEDGFDGYDDNDYYPIGSDYIEDETEDPDDSYTDYEDYQEEAEHIW